MAEKKSKNSSLIPPEKSEVEHPPRREFLSWLWIVLGMAVAAEVIWLVIRFLTGRHRAPRSGDFGSLMEAGPVDAFLPGTVSAFPRGRFYLARIEDGGFLAISRQCTHLGCTVPWIEEEKKFLCPCHSSAFDIRGDIVRSPAPRALDLFGVKIENRVVMVDTGRVIKRSRFSPDQLVYPAG
ncbi:MAG: Rieske 2Fe-2S domain-containing protein [Desulfobacterales bacterium]|jgi:cytochrome b6-f complex iron-sulfur subunit